jgi:uncharacterized protein (DUF4415 family)
MKTATKQSSALFRREKRTSVNANDMVTHWREPGRPLSVEQKRRLAAIAAMPDEMIDYSDIPPLDEDFWKNAIRNPYYKPVKKQLTVRLDADLIAWLRNAGKGYQTRLNSILRQEMLRERIAMLNAEPVGKTLPAARKIRPRAPVSRPATTAAKRLR